MDLTRLGGHLYSGAERSLYRLSPLLKQKQLKRNHDSFPGVFVLYSACVPAWCSACCWLVAFDASGRLFVVDAGNNRMQVFDHVVENNLTFITQWALPSGAHDVAVDSEGNVYVIAGGQVYKYEP